MDFYGDGFSQPRRRGIVPDDADQQRLASERDYPGGDVGRSSGYMRPGIDLHDRDGSFRRDALRLPPDVLVEHHVAKDQDGRAPQLGDRLHRPPTDPRIGRTAALQPDATKSGPRVDPPSMGPAPSRTVLHPARSPASTSDTLSPIMNERPRSSRRSSAASRSIPGLGFLQSHPASGGCGQYFDPSRTIPSSARRPTNRS